MARRFISKTNPGNKQLPITNVIGEVEMIIVDLGYKKIVLSNDKALELAELLQGAEMFEEVYISSDKRVNKDDDHTYHVYPVKEFFSMRLMGDSLYQMAKLAGKPVKS
jgi:hypothetical protein